jgi:hypothetical protein
LIFADAPTAKISIKEVSGKAFSKKMRTEKRFLTTVKNLTFDFCGCTNRENQHQGSFRKSVFKENAD